jgi:hypothetical protein
MANGKLTAAEITDLKDRLLHERAELDEQLTTIEDTSFAATQSDLSGDVGLDDESADAGTATFEREICRSSRTSATSCRRSTGRSRGSTRARTASASAAASRSRRRA